jgi:hypothetical protein
MQLYWAFGTERLNQRPQAPLGIPLGICFLSYHFNIHKLGLKMNWHYRAQSDVIRGDEKERIS